MKILLRNLLLTAFFALFAVILNAQTVQEDIHKDIRCTASNYMSYPGPKQQKLTPAPQGMTPFYISHYARHGSRFHTKPSMYSQPCQVLERADSLGKLTPLGRDVMRRLDRIRKNAENHWGDLTPIGGEQHRQIAQRMFERFPEVFKGRTDVDARSTGVARCVLSMEHEVLQLLRMNPHLKIHHNATHRDMDYLNLQDKQLFALKFNKAAQKLFLTYTKNLKKSDRLLTSLFNDTTYVNRYVKNTTFDVDLLMVAAIMQNTELGKEISLYELFSEEEAYRIWKLGNARWYIGWGNCPVNGGVQPYSQRNLLRKIIAEADSCIRQSKNNVQLRFGHETVLLPLICLLDIDGYGLSTYDIDSLEEHGWINYRIFPMAANIQFIFYRRSPKDCDVVFKVLLNENEATLPLPTDTPPYYKWSDFREYYLKKLAAYDEK